MHILKFYLWDKKKNPQGIFFHLILAMLYFKNLTDACEKNSCETNGDQTILSSLREGLLRSDTSADITRDLNPRLLT